MKDYEKIGEEGDNEQKKQGLRGKNVLKTVVEMAREETEYWAKMYYHTERDFGRRMRGNRIGYDEFLKWENDAQYNYKLMEEYEAKTGFSSRYERDKTENIGILDPYSSVEAKAGDFYRIRQRALNEAIEQSDSPTKEADLKAAQDLYRYVGEHIYYETDYETRRYDIDAYNRNRRDAHNNLIMQLNYMNELAEKYGVRRFTMRNFETNDFLYDEDLDIGRYTDRRAEYDRACVEAFCRNAFSSQYDKAMRDNGLANL